MPIRWSPQNDHTLLLKLLQVHPTLKVDCTKIAEAWPAETAEEKPTARAIRERLVTIKKLSGQTGKATDTSVCGTPQKHASRTKKAVLGGVYDGKSDSDTKTPKKNIIAGSLPTPDTFSHTKGENSQRKRKTTSSDSEEEAEMSSESESDTLPEINQLLGSKKAAPMKLRTVKKFKHDVEDLSDNDVPNGVLDNDDSDDVYDPVAEVLKGRSTRERRGERTTMG